MSDSYALFGYPVYHSWSPFIHGLFARQTGQDMVYRLHEAAPEQFRHDLLEFFFEQGGSGANITLPHKRAAADLVNELTPRAQRADAVNTVLRRDGELIGDNTDGVGLVADLTRNLRLRLMSPRILILGAGGAARGAIGPLLELKPSTLVIANRTARRASRTGRGIFEPRRSERCCLRRCRAARTVRPGHQCNFGQPERRGAADPFPRRRQGHRVLRHGVRDRRNALHAMGP